MNENKVSLIWETPEKDSSFRPTAREGFLMAYLYDKNKYIVFSGISSTRFSDVYTLSRDDWKWTQIDPKGEIPKECSYGVCWYDSPYFFFHGGRNKEISLSDTYFLDTETWLWRKVFTMEQPSARYHHAVAKAEGKEAYIFGGFEEKRNRCLGDLYRYEYKNLKISSTDNDKVSGSSWINVAQNNEKPSNRRGHSMAYYKGTLILYGGMGTDGKLVDDNMYRYTIDTKTWNIITTSGFKPGSRAFHSMGFFKSDSIIIFGGKTNKENDIVANNDLVYIDLNNWDCSTPFIANVGPSARFGHSCSFNSNNNPDEQLFLGGLDKTFCSFSIFLIKEVSLTDDKKWVYEPKKVRSNVNMENKGDIYETAKKTIIGFKKEIENLDLQLIQVNKKYSEYFKEMTMYKKNALEDDLNKNEKSTQLKGKKRDLDDEKNQLLSRMTELSEYDKLLNNQLKIYRERFMLVSGFLEECVDDVHTMDEIYCSIDKSQHKFQLFSCIDLDALSYKRKNYKMDLEAYSNYLVEVSTYEREIYDNIKELENEQKEKYQSEFLTTGEDKNRLDFHGELNDSLES